MVNQIVHFLKFYLNILNQINLKKIKKKIILIGCKKLIKTNELLNIVLF